MTPAAVVIARAPRDPAALAGLAPLFEPDRRAALQALLIRRAAAWAAAAAPDAAFVAVAGSGADEVAALVPAGMEAIAAGRDDPAAVIAAAGKRLGPGPLLLARTDCPALGPEHAAAALSDLAGGCAVVFGATLEGGWYLAGLREPRAELLTVAADVGRGVGPVLRRAGELGVEVGMLRHERVLASPGDVAALLADPLLPADLRAAIGA